MVAEDALDQPMNGTSPSGAWKGVLDAISSRNAGSANTHASGPDYFGLSVRTKGVLGFIVDGSRIWVC